MNFKLWWTQYQKDRQQLNSYERECKLGWDACKIEALKILKENTKHNFTSADVMKIGEELEKL